MAPLKSLAAEDLFPRTRGCLCPSRWPQDVLLPCSIFASFHENCTGLHPQVPPPLQRWVSVLGRPGSSSRCSCACAWPVSGSTGEEAEGEPPALEALSTYPCLLAWVQVHMKAIQRLTRFPPPLGLAGWGSLPLPPRDQPAPRPTQTDLANLQPPSKGRALGEQPHILGMLTAAGRHPGQFSLGRLLAFTGPQAQLLRELPRGPGLCTHLAEFTHGPCQVSTDDRQESQMGHGPHCLDPTLARHAALVNPFLVRVSLYSSPAIWVHPEGHSAGSTDSQDARGKDRVGVPWGKLPPYSNQSITEM